MNKSNDIELFLSILPASVRKPLSELDLAELVEVILDIGRAPEARFFSQSIDLLDKPVTQELINMVISGLNFGDDNRAGISGTLHRISAIRDRRGEVIGLTCRVGRAIYGTIDIIRDVVESGKSILVLGCPGAGKTTKLREAARILSEHKRVVIVDTSNEIAGDGKIPHPAIGRARRMPVVTPSKQAATMLEAVENHTPQVVVIDEIGDFKDVAAARTIAERGVQLIATAHGFTLDDVIENPVLADLLGGCQIVTLGDDEARKRGTKKTIVERRHRPTFDVVVEIVDFDTLGVYLDTEEAVDAYLCGETPAREVRGVKDGVPYSIPGEPTYNTYQPTQDAVEEKEEAPAIRVYALGLSRSNVMGALSDMGISASTVSSPESADLVLVEAKREASIPRDTGTAPVFVVRSNSKNQIRNTVHRIFQ